MRGHSGSCPIANWRHQHGKTRTDYRRGCRCKACREGEAEYQRHRRQRKKAAKEREALIASTQGRGKPLPPGAPAPRHGGTRTGFLYGCRCAECVGAEHTYQDERTLAIKAGTWVGRTPKKEAAT